MTHQPASDYADEPATEIDREPHWSSFRASRVRLRPWLPAAVQQSAAPVTPSAPVPVAPEYMLPFYSYAESQPQYRMETERVAPLPISSLRPSWEEVLVNVWERFAAPICGAIAGLILVVGFLAYSSQRGAAIASSAPPVAPIVMPAEVAMTAQVEDDAAVVSPAAIAEPTVSSVHVTKPAKAKRPASTKHAFTSGKRRPSRLDDATPLGDLRPSRTR